jgi:hypothetical protein
MFLIYPMTGCSTILLQCVRGTAVADQLRCASRASLHAARVDCGSRRLVAPSFTPSLSAYSACEAVTGIVMAYSAVRPSPHRLVRLLDRIEAVTGIMRQPSFVLRWAAPSCRLRLAALRCAELLAQSVAAARGAFAAPSFTPSLLRRLQRDGCTVQAVRETAPRLQRRRLCRQCPASNSLSVCGLRQPSPVLRWAANASRCASPRS